jgi:metallo-beta-lactamase class B
VVDAQGVIDRRGDVGRADGGGGGIRRGAVGRAVDLAAADPAPGHTRGWTTWTWKVEDGGKTYDVVVIGSPNVNPGYRLVGNEDYPEFADDFETTFKVLKALRCDIFLGAHGGYSGIDEKHARAAKAPPRNRFIDPEGYRAYVAQKEKGFRDTLAEQRAARARGAGR